MDLRERIVAARGAGESVVSVSQRFGVCTKMVRAYQARAKVGQLAPLPRPGKASRLRRHQTAIGLALRQEVNKCFSIDEWSFPNRTTLN